MAQGIGGVLLEHFVYDPDGNPLTTSFMDYLLPSAPEVPKIEYGHIETPSQHRGGWKGMGEGGAIGSPAAVLNAVADALSPFGVELTSLPLTPAVLASGTRLTEGSTSMKPAGFDYERPSSLTETLDRLATVGEDAKVLAGGQSLIPLMAMRLARPSVLIDVNRVEDLTFEADRGDYLELGALTRQRAAERSAVVRRTAPLLREALGHIGHPQIRNRGTIGGSLAHADPAAELPTVAVALDATMVIQRAGGDRTVAAADFFTGFFTTAIEPEELLTSVRIPTLPPNAGCSYKEFSRRHGDFAVVGVAAVVVLGGDATISQARHRAVRRGLCPGPGRRAPRPSSPDSALRASCGRQLAPRRLGTSNRRPISMVLRSIGAVWPPTWSQMRSRPLPEPHREAIVSDHRIELTVNGRRRSLRVEGRRMLADALREDLALTGTHIGCEHGVCGACTVIVDGSAVRSCLMLAVQADGANVLTVEGLADDGELHPVQEALWDSHAFQCGFCTPGFVMSIVALLEEGRSLTEDEIRTELSGNICRCSGYQTIVDGVQRAFERAAKEA